MRRMKWLVFVPILLLLIGAGIGFWAAAPRLVSASPSTGSRDVPLDAAIELVFSLPVDPETVDLEIQPEVPGNLSASGTRLTFTPSQNYPSGVVITATLRSGARSTAFPGLPVVQSHSWSFRTRQVLLAYLWPATGLPDLYALNLLSGKVFRLTVDAAVRDYAINQDRKWIYYTADRLAGGSVILRLDLSALETQPDLPLPVSTVLDCEDATCASPAPDPGGRYLAYERAPLATSRNTAQVSVWVLDLQTGETKPATTETEYTRYPAWSDTGELAFYNRNRQAYQVFVPGETTGVLRDLAHQTSEPGIWQPGESVLLAPEVVEEITGLLDTTTSGHLMLYTTQPPFSILDLTKANNLEDTSPAFSPDGSRIAFARRYVDLQRWTVGRQLWVMLADGSEARQLTDAPFHNHYSFAWSPDGQQIAFMRSDQMDLTQPVELWAIGQDGSSPVQLIIGGFAPQWIP